MNATFTTPSGAKCEYDTWYPFSADLLRCAKTKWMTLPTRDEAEQSRLQVLLADGRVWPWPCFMASEDKKHFDTKTHWRLPAAGYYEI